MYLRLARGCDITSRRAARIVQWFSSHWPSDLPWPEDIPRPTPSSGSPAVKALASPQVPDGDSVVLIRELRTRRLDLMDAGDWDGAKRVTREMGAVAERLGPDGHIASPEALYLSLGLDRRVYDDTVHRYRDGAGGRAPRRGSRYDDMLAALVRSGDVRFASRRPRTAA